MGELVDLGVYTSSTPTQQQQTREHMKVGEGEKTLGSTGEVNYFAQLIDEVEGLEKIENLQSHDSNEIYEKAVKILENYWFEEDEAASEEN